jgi:hypothetical protein
MELDYEIVIKFEYFETKATNQNCMCVSKVRTSKILKMFAAIQFRIFYLPV